jgi:hypothetical protein
MKLDTFVKLDSKVLEFEKNPRSISQGLEI